MSQGGSIGKDDSSCGTCLGIVGIVCLVAIFWQVLLGGAVVAGVLWVAYRILLSFNTPTPTIQPSKAPQVIDVLPQKSDDPIVVPEKNSGLAIEAPRNELQSDATFQNCTITYVLSSDLVSPPQVDIRQELYLAPFANYFVPALAANVVEKEETSTDEITAAEELLPAKFDAPSNYEDATLTDEEFGEISPDAGDENSTLP